VYNIVEISLLSRPGDPSFLKYTKKGTIMPEKKDEEKLNVSVQATAELQAEIDEELKVDDPGLMTALAVLKSVDKEEGNK